jgi:ABC-2 type transport system ATP-binding protein
MNADMQPEQKDASTCVVRFNGVAKQFGSARPVLRDIGFQLPAGVTAGLVGVNGAGKTTLIKCLLDFCSIDAGSIELFGLPHTSPLARRQLTFLPERFVPPYFLTGRQFVRATLAIAEHAYREDEVRVSFLDLDLDPEALDKPVGALSKGMTQKLGLAACLLSRRKFFLLDEPMSGLDPKARARVKAKLRQLGECGTTLLMTSHSLADIEEICDHMLVLHEGRIAFAGAPGAFRARFGEATLERAFLSCIEGAHV